MFSLVQPPSKLYIYYFVDPRRYGRQNEFTKDFKKEQSYGDGTVPSYSPLLAGFKWAWEFDNNASNAKPVKIIEQCS